jgi:beta-glucanase (GH16 family)
MKTVARHASSNRSGRHGLVVTRAIAVPQLNRVVAVFAAILCLVATLFLVGGGAGSATVTKAAATTGFMAQTSTIPQTTTSDGKSDCGGATQYKPDGTPWVCTFDDEFDGTALNTSKWSVLTTASTGYVSGSECYINNPNNVSVSGGTLNLTLIKTAPFTCQGPGGSSMQTSYTAGMVDSLGLFSQTYGNFEIKAKFPAATVQGLQTSLWLWPVNSHKYGYAWPASGEIDIAEWYSEYPNLAIPYIHYNPSGGAQADKNVTNDYCNVSNTNGYNTYAAVWTPQSITILIDGQTCLVDNWNPAYPLTKPAPFNMPFFMCLTAAMGLYTNAPVAGTQLPATSNIDYVRVWS